jgi:hypothetical protein
MTELEVGLIAIGGTFLVGVVSYNKWQEYKAKKSVERAFSSDHDDVLMHAEPVAAATDAPATTAPRKEPTLAADLDADMADPSLLTGEAQDRPLDATADTFVAPVQPQRELPVDELIDCVIPLEVAAPVRGERALSVIQSLRHVGNKPVNFIGQRDNGDWEPFAHGHVYIYDAVCRCAACQPQHGAQ